MTLTRAQPDRFRGKTGDDLIADPTGDIVLYSEYAYIEQQLDTLTARLQEMEQAEDHYQKTILQLDDKLARVTGERDKAKSEVKFLMKFEVHQEVQQLKAQLIAAQEREGRLKRIAVAFYDDIGLSDDDRKWWYENYADIKARAALTEPTSS